MRKIYTLVASIFIAVTAFGQYDLEVNLVTPASMSTVGPVASQPIAFTMTNNGATIPANSSLWFIGVRIIDQATQELFALSDGTLNQVEGVGLPMAWETGMTVPSSMIEGAFDNPFSVNTSTWEGNVVGVWVLGISEDPVNELVPEDPNDTNNDNNTDAFLVGTSSSIAINTKDIKVFPNPAKNLVNFQVDGLENGNIVISSITGQVVVNTTISGTEKVDVSNLNNGVYIYKVVDANGEVVKTNKLVINK